MRPPLVPCAVVLVLATGACTGDTQDIGDARTEVPTATATAGTAAGGAADDTPSPELDRVLADVRDTAPRLESAYRGGDYPRTLEEVLATLDDAGVALSAGNRIGAYRYDADAVEFELCIEHDGGAWATYDTAPMSTRDLGEAGGCPEL